MYDYKLAEFLKYVVNPRSETISTSQDGFVINWTRYEDGNGKDNYVGQLKKDGKEIGHVTWHSDGSVWYTDTENGLPAERVK